MQKCKEEMMKSFKQEKDLIVMRSRSMKYGSIESQHLCRSKFQKMKNLKCYNYDMRRHMHDYVAKTSKDGYILVSGAKHF